MFTRSSAFLSFALLALPLVLAACGDETEGSAASGAASSSDASVGGGSTGGGGVGSTGGAGSAGGAECTSVGDCRLETSYCGDCTCLSLAPNEQAPTCPESEKVVCESDPCASRAATCADGQCSHHFVDGATRR